MQPGSGPEVEIALSAKLLAQRRPAVALAGAGLSTRSGIPVFRSPWTGLWLKHHEPEVGSSRGFARDPQTLYDRFQPLIQRILAAVPTPALMQVLPFGC